MHIVNNICSKHEISYVRDFQDCWCHCPAVSASGHQQAPIKTDIAKDKTVSQKIRKCQTFKQHHSKDIA